MVKLKNQSYSNKLKDPRWQRKRLEIFERDNWKCQNCEDKDETLNIHHLKYLNVNPWDYPNELLITLCEECHKKEYEERKDVDELLVKCFKEKGFLVDDLFNFLADFNDNVGIGSNYNIDKYQFLWLVGFLLRNKFLIEYLDKEITKHIDESAKMYQEIKKNKENQIGQNPINKT